MQQRPIRSYVLRGGRLTPAQQRARLELWPHYGIDYAPRPIATDRLFGRQAPVVVEIGFGNGDTLVDVAAADPDTDFIGIEVHPPGVGAALQKIHAAGLANVRIISHDAIPVLEHMIPKAALAGVRLYFPDPWPKKRHHKRRIVQPAFLQLVAARLRPGGVLHMATDWEDYALQMLERADAEATLVNANPEGGFSPRPRWRPVTHFERRGTRLGHGVWDLLYKRH